MKTDKGMVLPMVIMISLILLTSIGVWYRKAIVQSFLSERLIFQRIAYKECNSLIPFLAAALENAPQVDLEHSDDHFLSIKSQNETQWLIGRSALIDNKIVFFFSSPRASRDTVRLTIGYPKNEN